MISRQALHLSTFTLDEFEHAIRHATDDPPCSLLAEVHSTLIYNLRTVPFHRHSAVLSLIQEDDESLVLGNDTDTLTTTMADVGNNWERVPLRLAEGRQGWEDALVGCIKDVSANFVLARVYSTSCLFSTQMSPISQGYERF